MSKVKASVKIMRSYDYNHFECSLSSDEEMDLNDVDDMRKECARLVDKAVLQYKISKCIENRKFDILYRSEERAEALRKAYKEYLKKQALNGKKGGRPKKNPPVIDGKPTENPPKSQTKPKKSLTTNQEPLTTNQEPLTIDKTSCQKNKFSDDDMKTAEYIKSKLQDLNIKIPNDLSKWANTIRLMRERDKRMHREICEVFKWANNHEFWRSNILSPSKLRKQFDQLVLQKQRDITGGSNVTRLDFNNTDWHPDHPDFTGG